jgi:hypothetical protein
MRAHKRVAIAAAVGSMFTVGQANAVFIFSSEGDTRVTNDSTVFAGANLSAQITYTLDDLVDSDTAIFNVLVANTTSGQPGTNRLVGFAVGTIMPSVLSITGPDGIFST